MKDQIDSVLGIGQKGMNRTDLQNWDATDLVGNCCQEENYKFGVQELVRKDQIDWSLGIGQKGLDRFDVKNDFKE